ncbi:MAG: hypothetical protein IPL61_32500 [Myxococcales bacterium]|nr:hypothetical protein [Myxococcales bacterium]
MLLVVAAACGEVSSTPTDAAIDTAAIDAADNVDGAVDAAPSFALTVTPAGNGAGTVTSSPAGITCGADCTEPYAEGTVVTLTAAPSSGSTFVGWAGGGCSGGGTCAVTVTAATTVTATFALNNSLVVTTTGTGTGRVTSAPAGIDCGADCSEAYPPATTVTLTATAAADSTFAGWSGGGCSGTGTCVVTVNAAVGVVATFTLVQYTLTVARAGTGTGTVTSVPAGITCGVDCTEVYTTGTAVTLAASPAAGSTFAGWSGGGCTGTGTCVVTLAAATTVTATFTLTQHTLVVAKAGTGAGTVTSSPAGISCGADCTEVYNFGTTVVLTATPAAGSTFAGWSGGGCTGAGTCTTTITAATTVTATFTLATFTLTVTKAGTGTGTVTSSPAGINCGADCTEPYASATTVVLTATPAAGSTFAGWSGGGCTGTGACTTTITAATTVTATFTLAVTNCDSFAVANTTTIPNWTENVGDWVIDSQRLRINQAGGIYANNITKNGSSQLNGCARLTALHAGAAAGEVVGIVLRWQSPANYVVALVQDNGGSGFFDSAWLYQMPLADIGGALTGRNFGTSPNLEACITGTAVTLRIDANQDGTYETTTSGTTTITTAGLAGVMSKTDSAVATNMPLVDNFCWGP